MTLEERVEMHEQWLLSMESNHSQFAAQLVEMERERAEFERESREKFTQISQILEQVVQHQAILSTRMAELAEQQRQLAENVNRYIRFRGNGQEPN
jgi:hypothetical protein